MRAPQISPLFFALSGLAACSTAPAEGPTNAVMDSHQIFLIAPLVSIITDYAPLPLRRLLHGTDRDVLADIFQQCITEKSLQGQCVMEMAYLEMYDWLHDNANLVYYADLEAKPSNSKQRVHVASKTVSTNESVLEVTLFVEGSKVWIKSGSWLTMSRLNIFSAEIHLSS